jgi:hypothetical protein
MPLRANPPFIEDTEDDKHGRTHADYIKPGDPRTLSLNAKIDF